MAHPLSQNPARRGGAVGAASPKTWPLPTDAAGAAAPFGGRLGLPDTNTQAYAIVPADEASGARVYEIPSFS
jgi:hypothetical protein